MFSESFLHGHRTDVVRRPDLKINQLLTYYNGKALIINCQIYSVFFCAKKINFLFKNNLMKNQQCARSLASIIFVN